VQPQQASCSTCYIALTRVTLHQLLWQLTWNSADERYRSPKLGSTVTTSLPLFSGRLATCSEVGSIVD
jgi:hypothetical protein